MLLSVIKLLFINAGEGGSLSVELFLYTLFKLLNIKLNLARQRSKLN